jgi:hypothetical protein
MGVRAVSLKDSVEHGVESRGRILIVVLAFVNFYV